MRTLWRILVRTVLWSYERGTWPYDLAVALIVIFVLLSPRGWFNDQPQVGPPAGEARIHLVEPVPATGVQTYRIDAQLVAPPVRTPELDHQIHDAMRKQLPELRGKTFRVDRITPFIGPNGNVLYYDVDVIIKP